MPPLNWGPLDSVHRRCPINAHWVKEGPSDLRWGPPRQDHCPPSSVWSRDSDQGCRPAGLGLEEFPDRFVSILFAQANTFCKFNINSSRTGWKGPGSVVPQT